MGFVTLILLAMAVIVVLGAAGDKGDGSPNVGALIALIIVAGMLLATCASCAV